MNNQELVTLFRQINKLDNCFDREIALKQAKKQYKKSQFYKQTHYSIYRAYTIFSLNGINTLSALLNSQIVSDLARGNIAGLQAGIEQFVETFDLEVFNNLFTKIADKLTSMQGDTESLKNDLQNIMKEFQLQLK